MPTGKTVRLSKEGADEFERFRELLDAAHRARGMATPNAAKALLNALALARQALDGTLADSVRADTLRAMEAHLHGHYARQALRVILAALEDQFPGAEIVAEVNEETGAIEVAAADGELRRYDPHPDALKPRLQ